MLQVACQRLDDYLLGTLDGVDGEAEGLAVGLDDDYVQGRAPREAGFLVAESFLEAHQRQEVAAEPVDEGAVHPLDLAPQGVALEVDKLLDSGLGHRVAGAVAGHEQGWDDRQGERDLDAHGRACARLAHQVDCPADALDVRAHHVHADPTPGHVGDHLRSGEARQEDKVDHLALAHLGEGLGAEQAGLDGLGPDAPRVYAGAVVGHLRARPGPPGGTRSA